MIIVNKCFEVTDDESASHGDAKDRGFEYEDQSFTFRDLVSEMRDYNETSGYPPRSSDWLISEASHNYRTGDETRYSLHFSRTNKPRAAKYWEKAMRKAGLLK